MNSEFWIGFCLGSFIFMVTLGTLLFFHYRGSRIDVACLVTELTELERSSGHELEADDAALVLDIKDRWGIR
jgi:hypothetical protein